MNDANVPGNASQRYELAQLNIALMKDPLESPSMVDFVDSLERINALADQSPGFVWRLETDDGDATALRPFGESTLVNMSVWKGLDALKGFVFGSRHVEIMRRRREWFEPMAEACLVLWWVPEGVRPTLDEARGKLERLRARGPSVHAFSFRESFAPPAVDDSGMPAGS